MTFLNRYATELSASDPYRTLAPIGSDAKSYVLPRAGGNWTITLNQPGDSVLSVAEGRTTERRVLRIRLQQDATGGRAWVMSPGSVAWRGGTRPTLATTANAFIIMQLTWAGALGYVGESI